MSSVQQKASNKRQHERHPVTIKVKVRPIGAKEWIDALLTNLSKGGSCIESFQGFFVGQMVEVIVPKQGGIEEHKLTATVVWKRDNRHGLNFM
ncbi:MAG: PilZ domain-containing protein [Bdellovibrionia bacterium]